MTCDVSCQTLVACWLAEKGSCIRRVDSRVAAVRSHCSAKVVAGSYDSLPVEGKTEVHSMDKGSSEHNSQVVHIPAHHRVCHLEEVPLVLANQCASACSLVLVPLGIVNAYHNCDLGGVAPASWFPRLM